MPYSEEQSSVFIQIGEAQAKIALHGAHVYSWTLDNQEQLFLSSASPITGPAAIRGGIPICFPIFGPPPDREPYSNLRQHGFARNLIWKFDNIKESNDFVQVKFSLDSDIPQVKKYNFPKFECNYFIKLVGRKLITELEVINMSEIEFEFQALLHTYLRLPSDVLPKDVLIKPLKGLKFSDKVIGGKVNIENRDWVDFKVGEVDRVYDQVPDQIIIEFGNHKSIQMDNENLPNLTIWNPHQAKSDAMSDMEREGWKSFVCVEPGQTTFLKLKPKESWKGKQELTVDHSKI